MKRKIFGFWAGILAVFVLVAPRPASAWIATGHRTVAIVAWDDLTPKTRAAVVELLKQHARYDKDLAVDPPADATEVELDRHVFANAATWPDTVRSQNNPMHTLYSHPTWHYIDIPYLEAGGKAPPDKEAGPGPHNAVEALNKSVSDLKDPNVPAGEKAVAICWIAHIVGDIHQPLHAVSAYSAQYPEGDQGGNAEIVLREPPYPDTQAKLHFIWDSLPGNFSSEIFSVYEAEGVRADPHFSREALKSAVAVTDFMAWAKESHDIAVTDAYLDGQLKAVPAHDRSKEPIPGLPPGYLEKAEQIALKRVALAGYRLADLLNGIFDPK